MATTTRFLKKIKFTGRLKLFFKSIRELNIPLLYQYICEAAREDVKDAFVLVFHIRDCRGGKGLRELGRRALLWLFLRYPDRFRKVLHLVPVYGRWDDFFRFFPGVLDLRNIEYVKTNYIVDIGIKKLKKIRSLQFDVVQFYSDQLKQDKKNMMEGKNCSLAAKWSPSEGDSMDRTYGVFNTLSSNLKITPRQLRKEFNTPLRAYLNIIENFICSGRWKQIDYNKVPSLTMKRLGRSFKKYDSSRFREWSINFGRKSSFEKFLPHKIVSDFRRRGSSNFMLETQWADFVNKARKLGTLQDSLVVCDASSSMYQEKHLPLDISCTLGMLSSELVSEPFNNCVITCSSSPTFFEMKNCESSFDRWKQISSMSWGGGTLDLSKVLKLILIRASKYGLDTSDMPRRIIVVSNKQYNETEKYGNINVKYGEAGYNVPKIIFWNLTKFSTEFSFKSTEHISLVDGFSPNTLYSIIYGEDFFPECMMNKTLNNERYNLIREALK